LIDFVSFPEQLTSFPFYHPPSPPPHSLSLQQRSQMALAEFLKQVDLEEMANSAGAKTKSDPPTTLETSESDKPAVGSKCLTAVSPPSLQPSPEIHGLRVQVSPSTSPERRRPRNQASLHQSEGRKNRRRNRNTSALQSRQRSQGLIDELWTLIPEEQKRAVEGQYVSRTEKIEMAIEVLKNFQDHQRV